MVEVFLMTVPNKAKERVRYMPLGLVVYKASFKSWTFEGLKISKAKAKVC